MNEVFVVIAALVNALILGFISRRLLGVPVGWPRTIVVSLLVSWTVRRHRPAHRPDPGHRPGHPDQRRRPVRRAQHPPGPAARPPGPRLGGGLRAGRCWSSSRRSSPPAPCPGRIPWLRGLPARWRRSAGAMRGSSPSRRGTASAGYLRGRTRRRPPASPTPAVARSVREALADGGVTFVKLGQMLATRPDLIGPAFARELSQLQSDVPASPWPVVAARRRVRARTAAVRGLRHASTRSRLAAASVAQVHAATLLDGTSGRAQGPAARGPGAGDRRPRHRHPAGHLAAAARPDGAGGSASCRSPRGSPRASTRSWTTPSSWPTTPPSPPDLDPRDGVVVPHAYRELSTSRLIVMERMSGTPVSRAALLLATMDPALRQEMARRLLRSVLRQVMVTGVFHADLHQGNVLVDETGPARAARPRCRRPPRLRLSGRPGPAPARRRAARLGRRDRRRPRPPRPARGPRRPRLRARARSAAAAVRRGGWGRVARGCSRRCSPSSSGITSPSRRR